MQGDGEDAFDEEGAARLRGMALDEDQDVVVHRKSAAVEVFSPHVSGTRFVSLCVAVSVPSTLSRDF